MLYIHVIYTIKHISYTLLHYYQVNYAKDFNFKKLNKFIFSIECTGLLFLVIYYSLYAKQGHANVWLRLIGSFELKILKFTMN